MPCLPVDSATSCSSHRPRPGSDGEITNVSLSRPACASALSAAPSQTAALGHGRAASRVVASGVVARRVAGAGAAAPRRRRPSARRARCRTATARCSARRCSGSPGKTCRKPCSRGELLEARAGVGDRDEVAARRRRSDQKWANSDSGSIVPPDFEETMNSVRAGSIACLARPGSRRRRSSRARAARAGRRAAERAAQHLRRERGAAHAEQHDVAEALARAPARRTPRARRALVEHALGDRQPAEPVGDLRACPAAPTASRLPRAGARATRSLAGERELLARPAAAARRGCERSTVRAGSLTPRS